MNVTEWLSGPLYRDKTTPTVGERMAELIEVNGGPKVRGWGFISGGGPYGRHGLEQEEALELLELYGVFTGFCLVDASEHARGCGIIDRLIQAQVAKLEHQQDFHRVLQERTTLG